MKVPYNSHEHWVQLERVDQLLGFINLSLIRYQYLSGLCLRFFNERANLSNVIDSGVTGWVAAERSSLRRHGDWPSDRTEYTVWGGWSNTCYCILDSREVS